MVYTLFRVIQATVVEHQPSVTDEIVDSGILVVVELVFHRTKVYKPPVS